MTKTKKYILQRHVNLTNYYYNYLFIYFYLFYLFIYLFIYLFFALVRSPYNVFLDFTL